MASPMLATLGQGRRVEAQDAPVSTSASQAKMGARFPDISFVDLASQRHHLSEYRGKYVLVDIWTLACHACVADIPDYKQAYAQYHARGFEILGLDASGSLYAVDAKGHPFPIANFATVRQFAESKGMTWPIATTAAPGRTGKALQRALDQLRAGGVSMYPSLYLLDPSGQVIATNVDTGFTTLPLRGPQLAHTLEQLLPATPDTSAHDK